MLKLTSYISKLLLTAPSAVVVAAVISTGANAATPPLTKLPTTLPAKLPRISLTPPKLESKRPKRPVKQAKIKRKKAPSQKRLRSKSARFKGDKASRKLKLGPISKLTRSSKLKKLPRKISVSKTGFRPAPLLRYTAVNNSPRFDIPMTYNKSVKKWINYFQTTGRNWFKKWMERSHRYLPEMKRIFNKRGLPRDLAYVAMIESGFSARAVSSASAVGYWQFIQPTANRYGLLTKWWIDERRDYRKSTWAAASYLTDLYRMFDSWYLAAAAYNMGEGRLRRLIKRYNTKNYWVLAKQRRFPRETRDYVPKLLAALMISKSPKLYGFHKITPHDQMNYDQFFVPGGTDLTNLAKYLRVPIKSLKYLNPELTKGFVPKFVNNHRIRIPKGNLRKISRYVRDSSKKIN